MDGAAAIAMNAEEVTAFLEREFPQIHAAGRIYEVVGVARDRGMVRLAPNQSHLRPGATVSGPTLMALADMAAYVAILGTLGPVALAVTTSFNINFLRRAGLQPLIADCRVLKRGRSLWVMAVEILAEGDRTLVAHATTTFSIPPAAPAMR